MSQRTREKQALAVFLLLIVLSTVGLAWYMVAGHSWNVAASTIDEKVGQMDGYQAIVFAGTLAPKQEASSSTASSASSTADALSGESLSSGSSTGSPSDSKLSKERESSSNAGSTATSSDISSVASSGSKSSGSSKSGATVDADRVHSEAASGSTSDVDAVAAGVSEASPESSETGSTSASGKLSALADRTASDDEGRSEALDGSPASASQQDGSSNPASGEEGQAENSEPASSSSPASTSATTSASGTSGALPLPKSDPVQPDDVASSYVEKGASVLVLDTADASRYAEGSIVKRGSKRVGIFSVDVPLSEDAAAERIEYFKEAKVDIIVCIASVRSYVRNLSGADIVITLQDEDVSTMGSTSNGTYYVSAPERDSVGAIFVSPSNVVSSKVIESL